MIPSAGRVPEFRRCATDHGLGIKVDGIVHWRSRDRLFIDRKRLGGCSKCYSFPNRGPSTPPQPLYVRYIRTAATRRWPCTVASYLSPERQRLVPLHCSCIRRTRPSLVSRHNPAVFCSIPVSPQKHFSCAYSVFCTRIRVFVCFLFRYSIYTIGVCCDRIWPCLGRKFRCSVRGWSSLTRLCFSWFALHRRGNTRHKGGGKLCRLYHVHTADLR